MKQISGGGQHCGDGLHQKNGSSADAVMSAHVAAGFQVVQVLHVQKFVSNSSSAQTLVVVCLLRKKKKRCQLHQDQKRSPSGEEEGKKGSQW